DGADGHDRREHPVALDAQRAGGEDEVDEQDRGAREEADAERRGVVPQGAEAHGPPSSLQVTGEAGAPPVPESVGVRRRGQGTPPPLLRSRTMSSTADRGAGSGGPSGSSQASSRGR